MPRKTKRYYDTSETETGHQSFMRHFTTLLVSLLLIPVIAVSLKFSMGLFHKLRKQKHEDKEHDERNRERTVHEYERNHPDINDKTIEVNQDSMQSPTLKFDKGSTITIEMSPYMKSPNVVRQEIKTMINNLSGKYLILLIFHTTTDEGEKEIKAQFPEISYRCLFYETDCLSIVRQFQPSAHFDQNNDRAKELSRLGLNVVTTPFDAVIIR